MGWSRTRGRGQSHVLGVALLFAIVITVSVTVVVAGGQALEQRQQATSMEGASTSFQRLDADLAQVASGSQKRVSVPDLGDGAATVQGDRGHVTVNVSDGSNSCTVVNESLGRVVYENGGRTLAYQGGGVFEQSPGASESAVVSAPPIQYQNRSGAPTLTLPLVVINGSATGDDFSFERVNQTKRFPGASCSSVTNPVPTGSTISITVTSEFYQAWGQIFEQRIGVTSTYDHSANQVTVEIERTAGSDETIESALSMSSSTGITNSARIDSYGPGAYGRWPGNDDGNVVVDGEITLDSRGSPTVRGDVIATGRGTFKNDPDVYGRTIVGSVGEETKVGNDAHFREVFSTKGDLSVDTGTGRPQFDADVIVGGDVTKIRQTTIKGDLHIGGGVSRDAAIDDATIEGDVNVGGTFDGSNDGHGTRRDLVVQGNISARNEVAIEDSLDFQGDVVSAGDKVRVADGTHVADVVSEDDVVIESGATVEGNVTAAGTVTVNGEVDETPAGTGGDVTADTVNGKSNVEGTVDETRPTVDGLGYEDLRPPLEPNVPNYDSAGPRIESKGNALSGSTNNDNSQIDRSALESTNSECSPNPCQVPPGQYYLDTLHLTPSDELQFQAGTDSVEIYVDGEVQIKGEVNVQGSEPVRIYTAGNYRMDDGNSEISVPGDKASRFWIYMKPGAEAELSNGATFTGVLYGPGSDSEPAADITVVNDATEVKGALVGQPGQRISNEVDVHYDERLSSTRVFRDGGSDDDANVGYLHVTTTTVEAQS